MGISLAKGSLIGLGGVGALGTGGYLAFRSQQPTDVKSRLVWDGLSVADSQSLGVYKALYLANHSKDGFSSFITPTNKDKNSAAPLLKAKCDELLRVSVSSDKYEKSLGEAKKWCLVPERTTIEISLHLEDAELSSSDDDYKSVLALNKDDQSFVSAIKSGASGTLEVNADFSKVKNWCEATLKKPVNNPDLKNAKAWCLKGSLSIKEKLEKDGLKMRDGDGWKQGYSSLKSEQGFLTDIGENSQPQLDEIQGGEKLKTWCAEKVGGKLYENSNYPDTYNKVKKYCVSN